MNGDDFNFSEKGVADISRKVNLLVYNVWTFLRTYFKGKTRDVMPTSANILDAWVLAKLVALNAEVTQNLDAYNTVKAGKAIVEFVNDLSTWYVRRSRDRMKQEGADASAAFEVLAYVLAELSKMLAPFMPFLADFIYKDITGKESVHLEPWSNIANLAGGPDVIANMEIVREAVTLGLGIRKEKTLAVRQPLQAIGFDLQNKEADLGPEYCQLILDELNVKEVQPNLLDKDLRGEGVVEAVGVKAVKHFYLDLNITPELKHEGAARELERQVQDLRKKSGLKVGDLVDLYYNTQDERLEDALLKLFDRKKTFVSQINKSLEVEVDFETQAKVDGKGIWLGMIKI
jgi:isoleucyl-tRNA synthetase